MRLTRIREHLEDDAQSVRPFLLADHEITREQFQRFIEDPDTEKPQGGRSINAAFCDGSVRFLSGNIDPRVLEKRVTICGREFAGDF